MQTLKCFALCLLLAGAGSLFFRPVEAQTPSPADLKAITDAIQTLQDQQATIADNEAKIDDKLASISDSVNQARIHASRAR